MPKLRTKLPNGLVFLEDVAGGDAPQPRDSRKIWSTDSCVAVVCMHEQFGEVELALRRADDGLPGGDAEFDAVIETPSREVMLTTVNKGMLVRTTVPDTRTRIRIWRNHPDWPDKVTVGLG